MTQIKIKSNLNKCEEKRNVKMALLKSNSNKCGERDRMEKRGKRRQMREDSGERGKTAILKVIDKSQFK